MPLVRIPRSASDNRRREATYATLIRCVNDWRAAIPFEGRLLRTGSRIEEAELRPGPDWPATPLLIEYAGTDHSGCGHNRSNDIHVLWKFTDGRWIEVETVISQGRGWWHHIRAQVFTELGIPPPQIQVRILSMEKQQKANLLPPRPLDTTASRQLRAHSRSMFNQLSSSCNWLDSVDDQYALLVELHECLSRNIANMDAIAAGDPKAVALPSAPLGAAG